jgi:hypothetical protein
VRAASRSEAREHVVEGPIDAAAVVAVVLVLLLVQIVVVDCDQIASLDSQGCVKKKKKNEPKSDIDREY